MVVIQLHNYWLFKAKESSDLNYLRAPTNAFCLCHAISKGQEVSMDCKLSAVHWAAEKVVTKPLEKH